MGFSIRLDLTRDRNVELRSIDRHGTELVFIAMVVIIMVAMVAMVAMIVVILVAMVMSSVVFTFVIVAVVIMIVPVACSVFDVPARSRVRGAAVAPGQRQERGKAEERKKSRELKHR